MVRVDLLFLHHQKNEPKVDCIVKNILAQLCVALGGRVEEIVYGEEEITTGASSDLQQVRNLARRMVTQWGFKNNTRLDDFPVAWESPQPSIYDDLLSPETKNLIDYEIQNIVKHAYDVCKKTLLHNRKILDTIAFSLIEHETISGTDVFNIINTNRNCLECPECPEDCPECPEECPEC